MVCTAAKVIHPSLPLLFLLAASVHGAPSARTLTDRIVLNASMRDGFPCAEDPACRAALARNQEIVSDLRAEQNPHPRDVPLWRHGFALVALRAEREDFYGDVARAYRIPITSAEKLIGTLIAKPRAVTISSQTLGLSSSQSSRLARELKTPILTSRARPPAYAFRSTP